MRSVMMVAMFFFGVYGVGAQLPVPRLSEFVKQKKKQTKRLVEQLALLQVYGEVLKKGYRVVDDGLQLISAIKQGDFTIHNKHFNSLKNVNLAIKNYSKVKDMVNVYEQITQLYRQATEMAESPLFTAAERDAVERIFSGLLREANKDLSQLTTLTTSGNFELKDGERLERIEGLSVDMRDKYAFAKDFTRSIALLQAQKQREDRDAKGIRGILDLNE